MRSELATERPPSHVDTGLSGTTAEAREVPDNKANLRIIGVSSSHDTLQRVVGSKPPARILDVPAGEGVFCEFLKERGWDVHAADIDPGNFRLRDVPFTRVNLNKALPFADASFDAVSCINGLHRLLFPEVAIREFARILRPGGNLYINLNNYSSIRKRLRFLASGSIDEAIETQECIQTIDDPEAHVRLPLMYPRLHAMLGRAGFEVSEVLPAAVSWQDRVAAPLALLISAISRILPSSVRDRLGTANGNRHAVLAGGAYMFIEATKPPVAQAQR